MRLQEGASYPGGPYPVGVDRGSLISAWAFSVESALFLILDKYSCQPLL